MGWFYTELERDLGLETCNMPFEEQAPLLFFLVAC